MNVLILTDFSKVSENAGKYAVDFLQETPANFFLLNIHDFNFKASANHDLETELVSTLEQLQKDLKILKEYSQNPKHRFNTILSSDNLINAVRKALAEKSIDLIFIGAASKEVHSHPILGDHAYEVVRKIKCNIMAVPGNSAYCHPDKYVLPVDYSFISRERAFKQLDKANFLKDGSLTVIELDGKSRKKASKKFAWSKSVVDGNQSSTRYLKMNESQVYSENLLMELQDRFDMILILGKNLSVCDHFLHSRYGLWSTMSISLPILVIHDC